jgi:hypothetical protein
MPADLFKNEKEPKKGDGESFQTKRDRITRMLQAYMAQNTVTGTPGPEPSAPEADPKPESAEV